MIGVADVPLTAPMAYVPCKGELGVVLNGAFIPLEYAVPLTDDVALPQVWKAIDREAPWIDQTGMSVATPCVTPYDWEGTIKTLILDTVADVDATAEEKALPGYFPNPGLSLSSRSIAPWAIAESISALVAGRSYQVVFPGTSDFTQVGAPINTAGTAFIATSPDKDATALVSGQLYQIKVVGTTDFTLIGAISNTVGIVFTATGAGTGDGVATVAGTGTAQPSIGFIWTFSDTGIPTTPHPDLRAGQTRYAGISGAAVGTLFTGKPFIPRAAGAFKTGTLRVSAFTRGLLLSTVPSYTITVKIGRATATWDKGDGTLALVCDTVGVTIKYSTDGSSPTTAYTGPIALTETKTVRWYATKTGMEDSTEWQTVVTFTGSPAEGPEDFETVYFSTLPTFSNSPVRTVLKFQRRPDWYVAPGAAGDGLTPSTPGAMDDIVGLTTTAGGGKAKGPRSITITKSGTANVALARSGENPSGSIMQFSTNNGGAWTTYSTPFALPAPGRFQCKLVRADSTDFTRIFRQPWFIGTGAGVQIRSQWDLSEQTLTLTYEPTPQEAEDVALLYSLDGSVPTLTYTSPVRLVVTVNAGSFVNGTQYKITVPGDTDFTAIGAADNNPGTIFTATGEGAGTGAATKTTIIPKVKAIHTAREPHDFPSATAVYTLATITVDSTPDFNNTSAVTWTAVGAIPSLRHTQEGDIVWAAEGEYDTSGAAYFYSASAIMVRGGFNSTFTERDVKGTKSIIKAVAYNAGASISAYNFYLTLGTVDGFWGETDKTNTNETARIFRAAVVYNCHFVFSQMLSEGTAGIGITGIYEYQPSPTPAVNCTCGVYFFETPLAYFCSAAVNITSPEGVGADAEADFSSSEESYFTVWSFGGAGSGNSVSSGCLATVLEGCDISINVSAAAGGAGGHAGGLSGDGYGWFAMQSQGGDGGGSAAYASCSGTAYRSNVNLVAVASDGGIGGNGGNIVRAMGLSGFVAAIGGSGGYSYANASAGKTVAGSATTSAISADGGDGGRTGSTVSVPYVGYYPFGVPAVLGGSGGSSGAVTAAHPQQCSVTASAQSGNGGDGGDMAAVSRLIAFIPPRMVIGVGAPGNSSASCSVTLHYEGHATATATAGDGGSIPRLESRAEYGPLVDEYYPPANTNRTGGGSYAYIYSGTAESFLIVMEATTTCGTAGAGSEWVADESVPIWRGYNIANTGSAESDWYFDPIPCQFESGDLSWTGTGTRTRVNPLAVNAVPPATAGWYSGTVDSNGAPLAGYETPQGTGVVLGDYWE
jgi:hypothetical protein